MKKSKAPQKKMKSKAVYYEEPEFVPEVVQVVEKFEFFEGNPDVAEIVAILDMSSSMESLTADTIGGFNAYLDELRKDDSQMQISLITFESFGRSEIVWNHKDIKECQNIDQSIYHPQGCTALLDALGTAIKNMHEYIIAQPLEKKPGSVSFFISTDGAENDSKIYRQATIKEMVTDAQETHKWKFIFAASNIDGFAVGANYGFQAANIANIANDADGQRKVFAAAAQSQMKHCKKTKAIAKKMVYEEEDMDFQKEYNTK